MVFDGKFGLAELNFGKSGKFRPNGISLFGMDFNNQF